MDYYDIISLLTFLVKQHDNLNYQHIAEIVKVIKSEEIPNPDKGEMFVDILKEGGLYPVDEQSGEEQMPIDEGNVVPIDLYDITLLDDKQRIMIILN